MFTKTDIYNEYKRLDKIHNQTIANTIPLEITGRCVNRQGAYKVTWRGQNIVRERIVISDFMLEAPEADFMDTIRHEYAHAAATRQTLKNEGHGVLWQAWARKVGAKPEQYVTEIPEAQKARIQAKEAMQKDYIVTCDSCGCEWTYHRKGKIVKLVESGSHSITCPYCHGKNFSVAERI